MASFVDLCRFNPTLGGTTDFVYSTAVAGCQSPAAANVLNGVNYKLYAVSADLSQWEIYQGAYNSSTGTFPRTTVLYNSLGTGSAAGQSGAGTKINFSTVPQVAVVGLAEDAVTVDVTALAPQGRLTLQSGSSVMTANQTAKSTIYYDSHVGANVWIYNGSVFAPFTIAGDEISMGLDAVTPHVASGSLYDVFAVNNAGALAIGIGPAWSSSSARGTGSGTTQLQKLKGIWTNANALTNCWGGASGTTNYGSIAANQATYLGTFYATANGQTGMAFSATAAGGGANVLGLWNAYNRESVGAISMDSASSWTYNSTTWRKADNNANNSISYVDGLAQSTVEARYSVAMDGGNASQNQIAIVGCALNWTSGAPTWNALLGQGGSQATAGTTQGSVSADNAFLPSLGFNVINAVEATASTNTVTFYGTGDAGQSQALRAFLRM